MIAKSARSIERWKNSGDRDLAVLAAWLYRHGEYQRAFDVIPVERALQSRELFLQSLDTLGALGRWSDIKELLERERFPLEPDAGSRFSDGIHRSGGARPGIDGEDHAGPPQSAVYCSP